MMLNYLIDEYYCRFKLSRKCEKGSRQLLCIPKPTSSALFSLPASLISPHHHHHITSSKAAGHGPGQRDDWR